MSKIRIESDGTAQGTKVYNGNGLEIQQCIEKLDYTISPGSINKAVVKLCHVELGDEPSVEFYVSDPGSGKHKQVKRIEFADGSIWSDNQSISRDQGRDGSDSAREGDGR